MTTILRVHGMTCAHCVKHVSEALKLPGVRSVDVKLEQGTATIEHDTDKPSHQAMIAAIAEAGYEAGL